MVQTQHNHQTPDAEFIAAIEGNDVAAACAALDAGADILAQTHTQRDGLQYAVERKWYGMAQALLERGADPNRFIPERLYGPINAWATPLMLAVYQDNIPMAELLLRHGADPGMAKEDDKPYKGAMELACIFGRKAMVDTMLRHGASPDSAPASGGTPLWYAAANGHYGIVCTLLNAGADANGWLFETVMRPHGKLRYKRRNAIFGPTYSNDIPLLTTLLDAGAGLWVRNERGENALDYARELRNDVHPATVDVFTRYDRYPAFDPATLSGLGKADLFIPNSHGYCLMDSPSTWQHFAAITRHLEQQGDALTPQDIQQKGKDGKTYFHRGVECFATAPLLSYYLDKTGHLPVSQLVSQRHAATPALLTMAERQQLPVLFRKEMWEKDASQDLQRIYHAVPEAQRGGLVNFLRLRNELQQREAAGRGR